MHEDYKALDAFNSTHTKAALTPSSTTQILKTVEHKKSGRQTEKVETLGEHTTPEKDKPTQQETPSEETEKDKTPPST